MPWIIPEAPFAVLQAMIHAGCLNGERLSTAELRKRSNHPDPVRALKKLRDDADQRAFWRTVIIFPGSKGRGGYGLATR
jgi:hypothetical protein